MRKKMLGNYEARRINHKKIIKNKNINNKLMYYIIFY